MGLRNRLGACALAVLACGANAEAAAVPLPEPSTDHILFLQTNDGRPVDASAAHGQIAFYWQTRNPHQPGLASFYYPAYRDNDKSHTIDWYQANRPDWVMYQCDGKTPAYDHTYSWGATVPLDITRNDVRQYILNTFLLPAIAQGFRSVSLDNVTIDNNVHRCGVWHGGEWIRMYSGEERDPKFTNAVFDYLKWLRDTLHAHGAALALNAKIDPDQDAVTRELISIGDMWLEEGGVDDACRNDVVDRLWRVKFDLRWWLSQQPDKAWLMVDKTCVSPGDMTPPEREWLIANFLLARGAHSYLGVIRDQDYRLLNRYPADFDPPVGAPAGPPHQAGSLWVRPYERGLVVVNPSSSEAGDFTLPPGRWSDEFGAPVSVVLHQPPHSGSVLLKAATR